MEEECTLRDAGDRGHYSQVGLETKSTCKFQGANGVVLIPGKPRESGGGANLLLSKIMPGSVGKKRQMEIIGGGDRTIIIGGSQSRRVHVWEWSASFITRLPRGNKGSQNKPKAGGAGEVSDDAGNRDFVQRKARERFTIL